MLIKTAWRVWILLRHTGKQVCVFSVRVTAAAAAYC